MTGAETSFALNFLCIRQMNEWMWTPVTQSWDTTFLLWGHSRKWHWLVFIIFVLWVSYKLVAKGSTKVGFASFFQSGGKTCFFSTFFFCLEEIVSSSFFRWNLEETKKWGGIVFSLLIHLRFLPGGYSTVAWTGVCHPDLGTLTHV